VSSPPGIFARLPKKRSPAALLVQSRVPQKSFLFLLEEKEIARQIKKCEENFFAEQRAKRAAAGRSKSVGVSFKISSDFFQQTPPKTNGSDVTSEPFVNTSHPL